MINRVDCDPIFDRATLLVVHGWFGRPHIAHTDGLAVRVALGKVIESQFRAECFGTPTKTPMKMIGKR